MPFDRPRNGYTLLRNPRTNKGSASNDEERRRYGLEGFRRRRRARSNIRSLAYIPSCRTLTSIFKNIFCCPICRRATKRYSTPS
jgi:hypothetical protein